MLSQVNLGWSWFINGSCCFCHVLSYIDEHTHATLKLLMKKCRAHSNYCKSFEKLILMVGLKQNKTIGFQITSHLCITCVCVHLCITRHDDTECVLPQYCTCVCHYRFNLPAHTATFLVVVKSWNGKASSHSSSVLCNSLNTRACHIIFHTWCSSPGSWWGSAETINPFRQEQWKVDGKKKKIRWKPN